eukprot:6202089-Pleurochrysis_carterae.AAC.2
MCAAAVAQSVTATARGDHYGSLKIVRGGGGCRELATQNSNKKQCPLNQHAKCCKYSSFSSNTSKYSLIKRCRIGENEKTRRRNWCCG